MKPFLQILGRQSTVENWRKILDGNNFSSFGLFAYITDSGVAQLINYLGDCFGENRHCRWVFSFDYGRSQPMAIRKLAEIGDSEIRIHDGEFVVQSKGFMPRNNFHLKTALTQFENGYPCKQIVGSGNLSASGLVSGIEAGCIVDYSVVDKNDGEKFISDLEAIWENATPFEAIIDAYEERYTESSLPKVNVIDSDTLPANRLFWIDVGYVTKNRGPFRPGNQFDLPRGSHINLGIEEVLNPELNSVLGELRIRTLTGDVIDRTLRYGNNSMEKLTLPIPERYGYQCYDGKILTFKVDQNEVVLEAFEHEDFIRIYGMHISSSNEMQSGRTYGTIILPE